MRKRNDLNISCFIKIKAERKRNVKVITFRFCFVLKLFILKLQALRRLLYKERFRFLELRFHLQFLKTHSFLLRIRYFQMPNVKSKHLGMFGLM